MPITQKTRYFAVDIYSDLTTFLDSFLRIIEQPGAAREHNIIGTVPDVEVDVALVLKTIPCLEQVDLTVGRRLLEGLRARSYAGIVPGSKPWWPKSRHGRELQRPLCRPVQGHDWKIERFLFATELVFRVTKGGD